VGLFFYSGLIRPGRTTVHSVPGLYILYAVKEHDGPGLDRSDRIKDDDDTGGGGGDTGVSVLAFGLPADTYSKLFVFQC